VSQGVKTQFEKDLIDLLTDAYNKGQAYYNADLFGRRDDSYQSWNEYEEPGYLLAIQRFTNKYGGLH
jgi:hypothetical protein